MGQNRTGCVCSISLSHGLLQSCQPISVQRAGTWKRSGRPGTDNPAKFNPRLVPPVNFGCWPTMNPSIVQGTAGFNVRRLHFDDGSALSAFWNMPSTAGWHVSTLMVLQDKNIQLTSEEKNRAFLIISVKNNFSLFPQIKHLLTRVLLKVRDPNGGKSYIKLLLFHSYKLIQGLKFAYPWSIKEYQNITNNRAELCINRCYNMDEKELIIVAIYTTS